MQTHYDYNEEKKYTEVATMKNGPLWPVDFEEKKVIFHEFDFETSELDLR